MQPPAVFIFSGPGGVGKTTLVEALFKKPWAKKNLVRAISATTRARRPGEKNGKDYLFFTRAEFRRRKNAEYFLETERVLDNFYGTPRKFYTLAAAGKKSLVLCIDVKGAMHLKKTLKSGKITTVFIAAPKPKDLLARLKKRNEKRSIITKRIALAKQELQFIKKYDYVIVNRNVPKAVKEIEAVIKKITAGKTG